MVHFIVKKTAFDLIAKIRRPKKIWLQIRGLLLYNQKDRNNGLEWARSERKPIFWLLFDHFVFGQYIRPFYFRPIIKFGILEVGPFYLSMGTREWRSTRPPSIRPIEIRPINIVQHILLNTTIFGMPKKQIVCDFHRRVNTFLQNFINVIKVVIYVRL